MNQLKSMARRIGTQVKLRTNVVRHRMVGEPVRAEDVHWMFVATLPNSGSTALAMLLATAPRAVTLNKNGEGQWLTTEMSREGKRWDPAYKLDYAYMSHPRGLAGGGREDRRKALSRRRKVAAEPVPDAGSGARVRRHGS